MTDRLNAEEAEIRQWFYFDDARYEVRQWREYGELAPGIAGPRFHTAVCLQIGDTQLRIPTGGVDEFLALIHQAAEAAANIEARSNTWQHELLQVVKEAAPRPDDVTGVTEPMWVVPGRTPDDHHE